MVCPCRGLCATGAMRLERLAYSLPRVVMLERAQKTLWFDVCSFKAIRLNTQANKKAQCGKCSRRERTRLHNVLPHGLRGQRRLPRQK